MTSKILSVTGRIFPPDDWTDVTQIKYDDFVPAWYTPPVTPGPSEYLYASIDASQLPVGAFLDGIQVIIKKVATLNRCRDVSVEFLDSMTLISETKKNLVDWPFDGVSYRYDTYGDSTDMWATSLTGNDLNTGNIWLRFKCERYGGFVTPIFRVDYIEITVYYSGGIEVTTSPYGPKAQSV